MEEAELQIELDRHEVFVERIREAIAEPQTWKAWSMMADALEVFDGEPNNYETDPTNHPHNM